METCKDFSVVAGETYTISGTVVDDDDVAIDMTGGEVEWATAGDVLTKSTALATIAWLLQSQGTFTVPLSAVETAAFATGKGAYTGHSCWAKTAAGVIIRVWTGKIRTDAPIVTPIV